VSLGSWATTGKMNKNLIGWSNGDSRIEIHVTDTGSAQKMCVTNKDSQA